MRRKEIEKKEKDNFDRKDQRGSFLERNLLALLVLDFIYSGLVRGFLPTLSNELFFTRYVLVALVIVFALFHKQPFTILGNFVILTFLILMLYQGAQLYFNSMPIVIGIYGILIYGLPFLGMIGIRRLQSVVDVETIFKIILFAIPINLLFVVRETIFGVSFRYELREEVQRLYSSTQVLRASGTFSSPDGYVVFLCVSFAILLISFKRKKFRYRKFLLSLWFILVYLSGSRTVIVSLTFFIAGLLIINRRLLLDRFIMIALFLSIITSIGIISFFGEYTSKVLAAFGNRWNSANSVDPLLPRILGGFEIESLPLVGEGLGVRSTAAKFVSGSSGWIEAEWAKIAVEGGIPILVMIAIWRLYFIAIAFLPQSKYVSSTSNDYAADWRVLVLSVVPWITSGQMFSQGSISTGIWTTIYLAQIIREKQIAPRDDSGETILR